MIAYRYLERAYARAMVREGIVWLASSESVADLETGLMDDNDCGIQARADVRIRGNEPDHGVLHQLRQHGVHIDPAAGFNLNIIGGDFRRTVPSWLFCCSDIPDNEHIFAQSPEKDTVVEIYDLEEFSRRLTLANEELRRLLVYPVPEDRLTVAFGSVEYAQRRFEGLAHGARPSPFVKDAQFAPERELRAVWVTGLPMPGRTFVCPGLADICRIVVER